MEEIIRTEHLIYEYAVLGDDGEPESVNRAVDDVSLSIRYSLLYSLAGAVLSLVLMALLKNVSGLHTAGVSVAGAVMHNIAQIGVAMIILGTKEIIYYLPPLLISGVVTGVAIGLVAALLIQRIPEKMTSF